MIGPLINHTNTRRTWHCSRQTYLGEQRRELIGGVHGQSKLSIFAFEAQKKGL